MQPNQIVPFTAVCEISHVPRLPFVQVDNSHARWRTGVCAHEHGRNHVFRFKIN